MQCRRWWLTIVVMGAVGASQAYAATVTDYVNEMKAGITPRHEVRTKFAKDPSFPTPSSGGVKAYANHVDETAKAFGPLTADADPAIALNSVMIIVELKHINADSALSDALKRPNPGVRYWAAKGLGEILPGLKPIGGAYERAVKALRAALATETSTLVKAEIVRALATTGEVEGMGEGLKKIAEGFATTAPNSSDISALADAIQAAADVLRTTPAKNKADQTAILTGAAHSLYYAAQYENLLKGGDPKATLGPELSRATDAYSQLITAIAGKNLAARIDPKVEWPEALFRINGMTGTERTPGTAQQIDKDVTQPGPIKKGKPS